MSTEEEPIVFKKPKAKGQLRKRVRDDAEDEEAQAEGTR